MAPKRFASPPPVESSEETGSGSGSDESEEEIAHSPPAAAPKNTAPPPLEVQQPEASDEEEEEEDEEEEEEEEDKSNHTVPPSVQNPPPKREGSESDEGEEEETDDKAPQPSSEDKKRAASVQRRWSKDDGVRILEALAAHRRKHGTLPQPEDLEATLAGNLDNCDYGREGLAGKLKSLKTMYTRTVKRGDPPSKGTDRRIFDLANEVWGGGPSYRAVPSDFAEVCEMYPYLAEEIKALEGAQSGLLKRDFSMMDNKKARILNKKIKKQKVLQMKLKLLRYNVTKEVTKTLLDLVE